MKVKRELCLLTIAKLDSFVTGTGALLLAKENNSLSEFQLRDLIVNGSQSSGRLVHNDFFILSAPFKRKKRPRQSAVSYCEIVIAALPSRLGLLKKLAFLQESDYRFSASAAK